MSVCSWIPETSLHTCLSIVGTIKENERTKEEQREHPCCGIRLHRIESRINNNLGMDLLGKKQLALPKKNFKWLYFTAVH